MQIVLTEFKTGNRLTLESTLILVSRKDLQEIGATHVITGIQGPNGLQSVKVVESPEEIGLLCNRAIGSTLDPVVLGYTQPTLLSQN